MESQSRKVAVYAAADYSNAKVYDHYRYKLGKPGLGSGEFNTERGAVSHAVSYGRTLCGSLVGSESSGWFRNHYAPVATAETVSCLRCRRAMQNVPALREYREEPK